jgi:hypothetical protein
MVEEGIARISLVKTHIVTYRIVVKKKIKWVEETAHLYYNQSGGSSYIVGTIRDITDQMAIRRLEDKREQELNALQDYLDETNSITILQEIVKSVKKNLKKILTVDFASIFINRGGALVSATDDDDEYTAFIKKLLIRSSCVNRCLGRGTTAVLRYREAANERDRLSLEALGAQLIVSLPVKTKAKRSPFCVWLFQIFTSRPRSFSAFARRSAATCPFSCKTRFCTSSS